MDKTQHPETSNNGDVCSKCRFLFKHATNDLQTALLCMRYPPVPVGGLVMLPGGNGPTVITNTFFPVIGAPDTFYCGEFSPLRGDVQ